MIQAVPTPQEPVKKRTPKIRVEPIAPTMIVELWRMVEHSVRSGGQEYPDISEEHPEVLRMHLFAYLQSRRFCGLIARIGRKPVGFILGDVRERPYGRPARYAFVQNIWVEESFRKQGVGRFLWNEFGSRLSQAQVHHFEALSNFGVQSDLTSKLRHAGSKMALVGGRL